MASGENRAKSLQPPSIAVPGLYKYVMDTCVGSRESPEARKLREEVVETHAVGVMSGAPDEAVFLAWMARLCNWKKVVEVGTFLGYTALTLAQAKDDIKVISLDLNSQFTDLAVPHWEAAGVADRIDLRMGKAADSMRAMLEAGEEGTVDFIFIDADKTSYDEYYELGLKLLRPGGVLGVDNTLWHGAFVKEGMMDPDHPKYADTAAIDNLNKKIEADERVDASFLVIADGLTLCTKR